MTTVHPEVLWAQRSSESDETKNIVYLTINLPDIQESGLEYTLEPTKLVFRATSGNEKTGHEKKIRLRPRLLLRNRPREIVQKAHDALPVSRSPQERAAGRVLAAPDQGEGQERVHQDGFQQMGR